MESSALQPVVSVSVSTPLSLPDAYNITSDGDVYDVGYGHEFGLICQTSEFFHIEWMTEDEIPGDE